MLFAAKHSKDRNFKLREDEITSCILGPLSYMPVNDVWNLFKAWLPFKDGLWSNEIPTNVEFAFWPNLTNQGRIEPDLLVRFYRNGEPMQYMLFEIKWDSPISGKDELVKQWEALSEKEKRITFHVYLVKHTGLGHRELKQSLSDFPKKLWRERLVCIGWRSLVEVLQYNHISAGEAINFWAEGVIAFLQRRGQSFFTGFDWLSGDIKISSCINEHTGGAQSTALNNDTATFSTVNSIFSVEAEYEPKEFLIHRAGSDGFELEGGCLWQLYDQNEEPSQMRSWEKTECAYVIPLVDINKLNDLEDLIVNPIHSLMTNRLDPKKMDRRVMHFQFDNSTGKYCPKVLK